MKHTTTSARYICMPLPPVAATLYAIVGFIGFLGVWAILVDTQVVDSRFLPMPSSIWSAFTVMLWDGTVWREGLISGGRVAKAVGYAVGIGVPLGILMGAYGTFESLLKAIVFPLRTSPITAFIPIFMSIFGLTEDMKIWFLAFGTIVYVVPLTYDAVRAVPEQVVDSAVDLGFRPLGTLWYFVLPASLPRIFSAVQVCTGVAWTYLVAAEIVNVTTGLGAVTQNAYRFQNTPKVFAGVLTIALIGTMTDQVFNLMRKVVPVLRPEVE